MLIDGELINQFANAIPKIASRNGDPPTMARQLAAGYVGLQTHGGNDRIRYREIQVKELRPNDIPVNVEPPKVAGSGEVGEPLTCARDGWRSRDRMRRTTGSPGTGRVRLDPTIYRAPSQFDLGDFTTPAEAEFGTQDLRSTDSLIVGQGKHYTPTEEDVGNVVHCAASVTNSGATAWATAGAPEITSSDSGG